MTTTPPSTTTLDKFLAAYLRLYAAIHSPDLRESQWQVSRRPVPREDTTERSKGLVSDPVANVTFDQGRLALRGAITEAERRLYLAHRTLQVAERNLLKALAQA